HHRLRRSADPVRRRPLALLSPARSQALRDLPHFPALAMRHLLCTLFALVALSAQAQDYPTHPIRLITPAAPGGTTDLLARLVGAKLGEIFGQRSEEHTSELQSREKL